MASDHVHCMSQEERFNSVIITSSFPMDINSKLVEIDNQGIITVSSWLLLLDKITFSKKIRKEGRDIVETIFLSCT